jgi:serine/threonine protein kinase
MRRFQVIRRLGSGINGEVVLARIRNLAFVVALKTVKKSQAQTHSKCLIEEIKIQAFLDHPNIIKLYGLTSDQDNIYLILEVSSHNLFR